VGGFAIAADDNAKREEFAAMEALQRQADDVALGRAVELKVRESCAATVRWYLASEPELQRTQGMSDHFEKLVQRILAMRSL
jgi:hypothetical protein